MSSLVQIRNVPDEARQVLKARAASRGKSLNSYMLELIEREVARPTVAEVFERAAARSEHASASATGIIRSERDARGGGLTRREPE
ncbi:MAG: hypothetical protein M9938_00150 [Solirubrobacterales bacterium]|nr:hypothetical protein [Solirubrobacterales bacterium]